MNARIPLLCLTFFTTFLSVTDLEAATRLWTGGGTTNQFSRPGNWQGGGIPQNGDTVIIDPPFGTPDTMVNDLIGLELKSLVLKHGTLSGNTFSITDDIEFDGGNAAVRVIECLVKLAGGSGRRQIHARQHGTFQGGLRLEGRDLQISLDPDTDLYFKGEVSGTGNIFVIGSTPDADEAMGVLHLARNDVWNAPGAMVLESTELAVDEPQPRFTGPLQVGVTTGILGARPGSVRLYQAIGAGAAIQTHGGRITGPVGTASPLHTQRGLECLTGRTECSVKLAGPVTVRSGAEAVLTACRLQENPILTNEPGGLLTIDGLENDHPDPAIPLTLNGGGVFAANALEGDLDVVNGTLEFTLDDNLESTAPLPRRISVRTGGVLQYEADPTADGRTISPRVMLDGGTFRLFGGVFGGVTLERGPNRGIDFATTGTLEVPLTGDRLIVKTNLTGAGRMILAGGGAVTLDDDSAQAMSTYMGGTSIRVPDFKEVGDRLRGETVFGTPGAASAITCAATLPGGARLLANTDVTFPGLGEADAVSLIFEGNGSVAPGFRADTVEVKGAGSQAIIKGILEVENTVDVPTATATLTVQGTLSQNNDSSVSKQGAGRLRFTGTAPSIYRGTVDVDGGTLEFAQGVTGGALEAGQITLRQGNAPVLRLTGRPQLNSEIDLVLGADGVLDASGLAPTAVETVDSLTGQGSVILPAGRLKIGGGDAGFTFAGEFSGAGALEKTGQGKVVLTGSSTHNGPTLLTGGVLQVDGSFASSATEVQRGTLGGTGTLKAVILKNGSVLAPGASIGNLTADAVTMESGAKFLAELGGTPASPLADQLRIAGNVTIQSGVVLELSGTASPGLGSVLRLIDKTGAGAVTGSFNALTQGTSLTYGGSDYTASYTGGNGNDFTLTAVTAGTPPLNLAPVYPNPAALNVAEGDIVNMTVAATDPNPGQTLQYTLVNGAAGMTLNAATGALTWTAGESTGGSSLSVLLRATDNGSPPLSTQAILPINVAETNAAPVFGDPPGAAALTVTPGATLVFSTNATDTDRPVQTLTYAFQGSVPGGMTIDSATGRITWVTDAGATAATPLVTVRVTDSGSPALSATQVFGFTLLSNFRDPLPQRKTVRVQAGDLLSVSLATTDPDVPPEPIFYSDPAAPPGVPIRIDANGLVSWQTTGQTAPGRYGPFVFRASHGGSSNPVDLTLRVQVTAPNTKPRLRVVEDVALAPGETVQFNLRGSDDDVPAQALTYSLHGAAGPANTAVNPSTGVVSLAPSIANNVTFYNLTARVTDDGAPAKSAERSFRIYVRSGTPPEDIPLTIEKRQDQPGYRLTFRLPENLLYEVQSSDDLLEPWITRETGISIPGPETYLVNPAVPRRFFRIYVP